MADNRLHQIPNFLVEENLLHQIHNIQVMRKENLDHIQVPL